jgi:hypothetical protein
MIRTLSRLAVALMIAGSAHAADTTGTPGSDLAPELRPVPFDSVTTARHHATAARLAAAIGSGDAPAFRALHSDAGWKQADDWWKAMYAEQKKRHGPILQVVGPLRGVIRMGQSGVGVPPDGMAILARFEGQLGAAMSFVLDDSGRIAKSNTWTQHELKNAAPDAAVLWERPRKSAK